MTYKAKVAFCSEIHKKKLNSKRTPCRIFEC